MPQLSDLIEKRAAKKFVKKSYRPWDLSGTGTVDNANKESANAKIEKGEQEVSQPDEILKIGCKKDIAKKTDERKEESHQMGYETTSDIQIEAHHNRSRLNQNPAIPEIIGNELGNNKVKTGNELGNNHQSIRKHIGNNQVTYREQTDNVIDNDLDNLLGNTDQLSILIDHIKKLSGIQRKLFFYVIDICSSHDQLDTGCILTTELASVGNRSVGCAKTSLNRLINKKLLLRKKGKTSRGGHIVLCITKEIQSAAFQAQRLKYNPIINSLYIDNALGNKLENNIGNNAPYSSSSIIKNTTTTELPPEWKQINFESLKSINFGLVELRNVYRKCSKNINADLIQDSINQFAFGLINNPERYKRMQSKSAVLVNHLIQGDTWQESGYVSPEEKAKREKEEKITQLLEQQFKIPKFLEWFNQLDDSEKEKIVPEGIKNSPSYSISKLVIQKEHAQRWFNQTIWPRILAELKLAF